MKALIVAGGANVSYHLLKNYYEDRFVVAVDSGIKNFIDTDFIPNLFVGDFDSIDEFGKKFLKDNNVKVEKYNVNKDYTDSEGAIDFLINIGVEDLVILGAIGSRIDHSLSNLFLLKKLGSIKSKIVNENNEIFYVEKGEYLFNKDNFKYISILPISEEIIFSTIGCKYEVSSLKLRLPTSMGVSNEIIDGSCKITIDFGEGFVIKSLD